MEGTYRESKWCVYKLSILLNEKSPPPPSEFMNKSSLYMHA